MGQALASAFPEAAQVFERADRALGFSIRQLCFEGPISELTLTKHTQPAIVTASIAALAAIVSAYPNLQSPDFAAGHSLGEYSALVAAGTLTLEDAVRIVHLRGQSMQDAVPEGEGGMAAIMGGDRAAVEALCAEAAEGDVVAPANFNAPGQIVISGHKRAVERAAALASSKKLKAIPLKVSAPFHCALMAPAARAVEAALAELTLQAPRFPVVANVSALPNDSAEEAKSLLVRQTDGPVLWEQTIARMADAGVSHALEIGPGKVLAGLVKRIDKRIAVLSVGDPDSIRKIPEFLGLI
jgi:[acyl-carrier-protein] S-malonyltransferase